jgi:hypothetical protein
MINNKYYCLIGSEDYLDDHDHPRINKENDNRVVAKAVQTKKPKHFGDKNIHYRFYIKMTVICSPDLVWSITYFKSTILTYHIFST